MNERSRGARYAISALKNKRATLAAEIVQLESQIKARKHSLEHVDACLRLLDPSVDVDAIPNKRVAKHINLFRQGELGRLVLGALRNAHGKPLSTADVVDVVVADGGYGDAARAAMRARVRSNLAYLERRGKVEKVGERGGARWALINT